MSTTPIPWFRKHHTCPCGTDWWDEWDCLCNDRCPTCDAEIEPDEHEAIQGAKSAKIRTLNDRFRKSLTGGRVMMMNSLRLPNFTVFLQAEFSTAPDRAPRQETHHSYPQPSSGGAPLGH